MSLYHVSVATHILSAMVWIGGTLFIVLVLVPVTRRWEPQAMGARFLSTAARRFRWVAWVCLGLLVVTGVANLSFRGIPLSDLLSGEFYSTPFGAILRDKLVIVGLVLALSAVHDFILGPRVARQMEEARRVGPGGPSSLPPGLLRQRVLLSWLARLNLLLALAIVLLAVTLVR